MQNCDGPLVQAQKHGEVLRESEIWMTKVLIKRLVKYYRVSQCEAAWNGCMSICYLRNGTVTDWHECRAKVMPQKACVLQLCYRAPSGSPPSAEGVAGWHHMNADTHISAPLGPASANEHHDRTYDKVLQIFLVQSPILDRMTSHSCLPRGCSAC